MSKYITKHEISYTLFHVLIQDMMDKNMSVSYCRMTVKTVSLNDPFKKGYAKHKS